MSLARPAGLSAQTKSWTDTCLIGSLEFCASVDLTLNDLGGFTAMTVRVRNLQGSSHGSIPWGMYELGFFGLPTNLPDNQGGNPQAGITLTGSARAVATINQSFCAIIFSPAPCPANLDSVAASHTQEWDYGAFAGRGQVKWTWSGSPWDSPVVGCEVPARPGNPNVGLATPWAYLQTCGDGWVTYSMVLIGDWSIDENTTMGYFAGYGGTRGDCDPTFYKCELVTPEPATLLLMATGIGGLGAVRRRRKGKRLTD